MKNNIMISSTEEFMNRDTEVVDYTVGGKCSNCGACCTNMLPLTNADINRIKNFIHKNNIYPRCDKFNYLNQITIDLVCPFRDNENNKCVIYEVRPLICKCFCCNDIFSEVMKQRNKFKDIKPINVRNTFYG